MSFQLCPKCKGTGSVEGWSLTSSSICPVCKGAMIISEVTGLPPNSIHITSDLIRGQTTNNKNCVFYIDDKEGEKNETNQS